VIDGKMRIADPTEPCWIIALTAQFPGDFRCLIVLLIQNLTDLIISIVKLKLKTKTSAFYLYLMHCGVTE
jgi:hypothetical protein